MGQLGKLNYEGEALAVSSDDRETIQLFCDQQLADMMINGRCFNVGGFSYRVNSCQKLPVTSKTQYTVLLKYDATVNPGSLVILDIRQDYDNPKSREEFLRSVDSLEEKEKLEKSSWGGYKSLADMVLAKNPAWKEPSTEVSFVKREMEYPKEFKPPKPYNLDGFEKFTNELIKAGEQSTTLFAKAAEAFGLNSGQLNDAISKLYARKINPSLIDDVLDEKDYETYLAPKKLDEETKQQLLDDMNDFTNIIMQDANRFKSSVKQKNPVQENQPVGRVGMYKGKVKRIIEVDDVED